MKTDRRMSQSHRPPPFARPTMPPMPWTWCARIRPSCAALDFAVSRMCLNETERAALRAIADVLLDMERAS